MGRKKKDRSIEEKKEVVSIGHAVKMLGIGRDAIVQYVDSGLLPAMILPSGHRRFRVTDLEAFQSKLFKGGQIEN